MPKRKVITLPVGVERDVPAATQEEFVATYTARRLNVKRMKLLGWTFTPETDSGTNGNSNEIFILKNYTNVRDVLEGIGGPTTGPVKGEQSGLISKTGLFYPGGQAVLINTHVNLPEPVVFDEDDVLALHFILVNKDSAASHRFENWGALYVEVEE